MSQNGNLLPLKPIVYGSLVSIGIIVFLTLIVTVLTEFGWTGTIQWSDNLFLILSYLGISIGSIIAGLKSREQGWLTGLGSGLLSSLWIFILAILIGNSINWGLFLIKSLISGFIGAFGGIIGVNISGNHP